MKKSKNKILIIAAHPDDEVLGCGGTIARFAKMGDRIFCLFLGKGKTSRYYQEKKSAIQKEQQSWKKKLKRRQEF